MNETLSPSCTMLYMPGKKTIKQSKTIYEKECVKQNTERVFTSFLAEDCSNTYN